MILGDSLQVMASLAEREGLRGQVQCIYIDPPYDIRFNSNFQWSTTSRDVKDGNAAHITREPEQVKASATPGDTASTRTCHIFATGWRSPGTCSAIPAPSSSRSGMRTSIGCGCSWMRRLGLSLRRHHPP